jgi:hypothetical protein
MRRGRGWWRGVIVRVTVGTLTPSSRQLLMRTHVGKTRTRRDQCRFPCGGAFGEGRREEQGKSLTRYLPPRILCSGHAYVCVCVCVRVCQYAC